MKYEIRRANEFAWGPDGPWQVERVSRLGERYVVGIFEDIADANEVMRICERSIEYSYERWGHINGKRQSVYQEADDQEGGGDAA